MKMQPNDVKEYKRILIETLKYFDSFCKKNNIKYVGAAGTAIGTVRHKGIIPWDDDIDVIMTYDQYEKFLMCSKQLEDTDYEIFKPGDHRYYLSFSKFCNKKTTIWEISKCECVIGVFIDVFPVFPNVNNLTVITKDRDKYMSLFSKYVNTVTNIQWLKLLKLLITLHLKSFICLLYNQTIGKLLSKRYLNEFLRFEKEYGHRDGEIYLPPIASYGIEREILNKELFDSIVYMPFEDTLMPMFKDYDTVLTRMYKDYMTPPPPEKRISHHYLHFYDLKRRWDMSELRKLKLDEQEVIDYTYE